MKGSTMKDFLGNRRTAARWVLTVAAAAAFVAAAPQARAGIITHSTAGVLVSDGFEGPTDTVGSFPVGWTVAKRIAAGGPGGVTTADIDVENGTHAAPTPPAANEGSNFLAVRTNNEAAYQSFGPFTSGTITAQFAFYLPRGNPAGTIASDDGVFPTFMKSTADVGLTPSAEWIGFEGNAFMNANAGASLDNFHGGLAYYDGSSYAALTTGGGSAYSFTLDAWHIVTMTDDIAAGTAASAITITIDGVTIDPLATPNLLANGTVDGFQIFDNNNGVGFIDTLVPEPASLTLLCGGAVMLLSRRRA